MEGSKEEEEMERPVVRTLFRQSSVEMRVYPVQDTSDISSEEDEDYTEKPQAGPVFIYTRAANAEEPQEEFRPRVVSAVEKRPLAKETTGPEPPSRVSSLNTTQHLQPIQNRCAGEFDLSVSELKETENEVKGPISPAVNISTISTMERKKVQFMTPDKSEPQFIELIEPPAAPSPPSQHRHSSKVEYAEATYSVGSLKAQEMASPRPKSPRPGTNSTKPDKEESFWEKIGTLGRKKRIKEVQEVQEEGKYAIDSPGNPIAADLPPEEYALDENEERSMITPQSLEDRRLRELMEVLIEWINDELASHRIIVKNLEEDLYDGQVLHKLIESLTGEYLDVPEVTQSEEGQRQKLNIVLATANKVLGLPRWSQNKWSVDSIHSKNLVAILHLLVALARHFRAPVRLPERVGVQVVVVQKVQGGALSHRTVTEEITSTYDDLGLRGERDAFDTLFDHAPDKLQVVKKSLVTFVNKHLNKLGLEVTDLDSQFHDGVYLALLMGLLEGFFVPLYAFYNTPQDFDQKVHNVNLAFELMQEVGLGRPKARPEDIVNLDLKSTLRVLYNLFTKYKNLS
ncbi:beta-parvin [Neocloeon triangulifer]|uniref:beta-parvin n=1 Tax=Neocloeon triangulifer TaxID=2078957 RepID=UPI00286F8D40|nr:beta-parvin [Neocloeon triangulifer]